MLPHGLVFHPFSLALKGFLVVMISSIVANIKVKEKYRIILEMSIKNTRNIYSLEI